MIQKEQQPGILREEEQPIPQGVESAVPGQSAEGGETLNQPPQGESLQGVGGEQAAIAEDEGAAENIEGSLIDPQKAEKQQAKLGPAQQAQLDAYQDNATIVVFSEKYQPEILQELQLHKDDNVKNIAEAANTVHRQLQNSLNKKGEKMTEITLALGSAYLVSQLIVLAEAAKLFSLNQQEKMYAYKATLQMYFKEGLVNGTINVVKFQKTLESLMTPEQRAQGEAMAQKNGLSKTAPPDNSGMALSRQSRDKETAQQHPQQSETGSILGGM